MGNSTKKNLYLVKWQYEDSLDIYKYSSVRAGSRKEAGMKLEKRILKKEGEMIEICGIEKIANR